MKDKIKCIIISLGKFSHKIGIIFTRVFIYIYIYLTLKVLKNLSETCWTHLATWLTGRYCNIVLLAYMNLGLNPSTIMILLLASLHMELYNLAMSKKSNDMAKWLSMGLKAAVSTMFSVWQVAELSQLGCVPEQVIELASYVWRSDF